MIGVDVYHDPAERAHSVVGFVSTLNTACTRWYSQTAIQNLKQELADCLRGLFEKAVVQWTEENGVAPKRVIYFRDGVGDGDIPQVQQYEIPQLTAVLAMLPDTYFTFILVQKRINTRIFLMARDRMDNPAPGTVLDHTITRRNHYDFFLVSQLVRQGTVSPTHYVVLEDTSTMKVDHVQKITYKMTHLYYNWPGTVRVPAPCQYAHKLAALVGMHLRSKPSDRLSNKLFFL